MLCSHWFMHPYKAHGVRELEEPPLGGCQSSSDAWLGRKNDILSCTDVQGVSWYLANMKLR